MKRRIASFLEGIVTLAVVLVLFQTLLEEIAVLAAWPWEIRWNILLAGMFFDLFFTVEFLLRFYSALSRGEAEEYFFRQRGWIDFAASIPLLLLSSAPLVLAASAGPAIPFGFLGTLNLLKAAETLRVARFLRLLRLLKLFRRIRYEQSPMAQRHITTIIIVSLTVTIFAGIGFELLFGLLEIGGVERVTAERHNRFERQIVSVLTEEELRAEEPGPDENGTSTEEGGDSLAAETGEATGTEGIDLLPEGLAPLLALEHTVLIIREGERTLYSRYGNEYYAREFGPSDYRIAEEWRFTFFYDMRPLSREQARTTLLLFSVAMALILAFLLYYSPLFAMTVTDPIRIMRRGMTEGSYDLKVRIPRRYRDDDLFLLAETYNAEFLPLKDRERSESGSELLDLRMEDIEDLLKEGM